MSRGLKLWRVGARSILASALACGAGLAACSSGAAGPPASTTVKSEACAPETLEASLIYTPSQPVSPAPADRVVQYTRRDGTVGREMQVLPLPLSNSVCRYQLPEVVRQCAAGQINAAMKHRDIASGASADHTVDLDCSAVLKNGDDIVARYVRTWAKLGAADDICREYDVYDSELKALQGAAEGGLSPIREIPFVRGYLAEMCVGDDAAISFYAQALRAGYPQAELRMTTIFVSRRGQVAK